MDLIRFRVQELIVLLSRAAIEGGAVVDEVLNINNQRHHELNKFVSLEAIAYWLSKVLKQYVRLVFSARQFKHVSTLEQVLQYIHQHYTEKVSLQDAADHAGLSHTYLSKIFNEEMGCSFTYYLNQNRVDHAKTLLRSSRHTLVYIAGAVGFDDQSYFSKIFKQHTGITPGKYRERAGRYPEGSSEIHQ
jgi:YesN/AraC family two-component response regulator